MYYMPSTVISGFHAFPHFIWKAFSKVDITVFPILLMRKPRLREVN